MEIKVYNELPDEAREIREEVFVREQGFNEEFDTTDETAIHFLLFDSDEAAAVCRAFSDDNGESYHIGRLAVKKKYRGEHLGAELLHAVEKHIQSLGAKQSVLSAQLQAEGFYEKQGYTRQGDIYYDEHCPHILMMKKLR